MTRASARQFARVLTGLAIDRYSSAEVAAGLRLLLRRYGWSNRLPLIRAALKYELPGAPLIVETAKPLADSVAATVRTTLARRWSGRDVRFSVNLAVRGGLRLRVDQQTLDYSLAHTLQQLQQTLREV